jgi:hypothetical protein
MSLKIEYFTNLIDGYDNLNEIYDVLLEIMEKVHVFNEDMTKATSSSSENMYFLKIFALFKLKIMNDPITVYINYKHI